MEMGSRLRAVGAENQNHAENLNCLRRPHLPGVGRGTPRGKEKNVSLGRERKALTLHTHTA